MGLNIRNWVPISDELFVVLKCVVATSGKITIPVMLEWNSLFYKQTYKMSNVSLGSTR